MDDDFDSELDVEALSDVMGDLEERSRAFGAALTQALRGAAVEGRNLDQVLRALALRVTDIALDVGLKPLENVLSNAFAGLGSAATGILPFAKGGVVSAPTLFPLGGETGLMGEAGAEAILPLARGPDGRLGVAASRGPGAPTVVFNVTATDAASFRRSEAQVTAMLARAVGRGQRSN